MGALQARKMIPPDGLRQGRQSRRPFAKALQKRPMRMHSGHHPRGAQTSARNMQKMLEKKK